MKQQIAILIGTLLILPGCAKNDSDATYGSTSTDQDTTATGAPASAQTQSEYEPTASGSAFDTNGEPAAASAPGANPAPAANTPPPVAPPPALPADTNQYNQINPSVPAPQ